MPRPAALLPAYRKYSSGQVRVTISAETTFWVHLDRSQVGWNMTGSLLRT